MNPLKKRIINHKINTITAEELYTLATQYDFDITKKQAQKVMSILRQEILDIDNFKQRDRMLKRVGKEVDKQTQRRVKDLLDLFYTQYYN